MISNFPLQAVELDDLSPVDDLVKHSSSAVDIRTVLMQVVFLQIANCICTNWNTQALQLTFALSSCRLFELIIFQFKKKNILSFKLCNKHLHNAHAVFWERKTSHTLLLLLPQKTFMFHFYISLISFFQIKTFWAQLSWPDVESSYAYISKILDVSVSFVWYGKLRSMF